LDEHSCFERLANAGVGLIRNKVDQWYREGTHGRLANLAAEWNGLWQQLWRYVRLKQIIRQVKGFRGRQDPAALYDFASDPFGGALNPLQVRSEFLDLLGLLAEQRPRRVLEIGTATGGTLLLLCHAAASDALLISVDLPGGPFGAGWPGWQLPLLRAFPLPGQRLELLRANSHDPAVLERVRGLLGGDPLDFLFIDGDHRYEGVKQDFETYGSLVRPGGLVAVHDISVHPFGLAGEVPRFWQEIRPHHRTRELVAGWDCGLGIGIVWH